MRRACWQVARWLAWPVKALLTRKARHGLGLEAPVERPLSEFARRQDEGPWASDFVCPRCDAVFEPSAEMWAKLGRRPEHTVGGRELRFNHRCGECGNAFRVCAVGVVCFRSSQLEYLPASVQATHAGWRVLDGGRM